MSERKRGHTPKGTKESEATGANEVFYWMSPDTDPVVGRMSDEDAIKLAVKATQARFRRKGVSDQDVMGKRPSRTRPSAEKTAAKKAHNLLLALLNNTSIEYSPIAIGLGEQDSEATRDAMNRASTQVSSDEALHSTFEGIQDSYLKRFAGRQALEQ